MRWSSGKGTGLLIEGTRFESTSCRFKTWATSFNPRCLCLLEELKAVGPSSAVDPGGLMGIKAPLGHGGGS